MEKITSSGPKQSCPINLENSVKDSRCCPTYWYYRESQANRTVKWLTQREGIHSPKQAVKTPRCERGHI